MTSPGEEPIAEKGRGCYVEADTVERYVDYMLGSGAVICGHAHPHADEAFEMTEEAYMAAIEGVTPN